MMLNPYLNFDGKTEEAFKFYHSVFDGDAPQFMRFKDTPHGKEMSAEDGEKIMHVNLNVGQNAMLMASDSLKSMGQKLVEGNNFSIAIHVESREEADKMFNGLSADGEVEIPMDDTFWGDYFGMLKDKFGVRWMISFPTKKQ